MGRKGTVTLCYVDTQHIQVIGKNGLTVMGFGDTRIIDIPADVDAMEIKDCCENGHFVLESIGSVRILQAYVLH